MTERENDITRVLVNCISHLERHRRKFVNERLKEYDLRGSMFLALLFLNRHPGSSQDTLCNELLIDKGNAARLCRQLEEAGYIRREQSPEDRRQNMLFLTDYGKEHIPIIRGYIQQWRNTASSGMTEDELETLANLLLRMKENLSNVQ